jgi:hypothetical protein
MALNRVGEAHVSNAWAVGGNVNQNYNGSAWATVSVRLHEWPTQNIRFGAAPGCRLANQFAEHIVRVGSN